MTNINAELVSLKRNSLNNYRRLYNYISNLLISISNSIDLYTNIINIVSSNYKVDGEKIKVVDSMKKNKESLSNIYSYLKDIILVNISAEINKIQFFLSTSESENI